MFEMAVSNHVLQDWIEANLISKKENEDVDWTTAPLKTRLLIG
jgi:hypothetical protein